MDKEEKRNDVPKMPAIPLVMPSSRVHSLFYCDSEKDETSSSTIPHKQENSSSHSNLTIETSPHPVLDASKLKPSSLSLKNKRTPNQMVKNSNYRPNISSAPNLTKNKSKQSTQYNTVKFPIDSSAHASSEVTFGEHLSANTSSTSYSIPLTSVNSELNNSMKINLKNQSPVRESDSNFVDGSKIKSAKYQTSASSNFNNSINESSSQYGTKLNSKTYTDSLQLNTTNNYEVDSSICDNSRFTVNEKYHSIGSMDMANIDSSTFNCPITTNNISSLNLLENTKPKSSVSMLSYKTANSECIEDGKNGDCSVSSTTEPTNSLALAGLNIGNAVSNDSDYPVLDSTVDSTGDPKPMDCLSSTSDDFEDDNCLFQNSPLVQTTYDNRVTSKATSQMKPQNTLNNNQNFDYVSLASFPIASIDSDSEDMVHNSYSSYSANESKHLILSASERSSGESSNTRVSKIQPFIPYNDNSNDSIGADCESSGLQSSFDLGFNARATATDSVSRSTPLLPPVKILEDSSSVKSMNTQIFQRYESPVNDDATSNEYVELDNNIQQSSSSGLFLHNKGTVQSSSNVENKIIDNIFAPISSPVDNDLDCPSNYSEDLKHENSPKATCNTVSRSQNTNLLNSSFSSNSFLLSQSVTDTGFDLKNINDSAVYLFKNMLDNGSELRTLNNQSVCEDDFLNSLSTPNENTHKQVTKELLNTIPVSDKSIHYVNSTSFESNFVKESSSKHQVIPKFGSSIIEVKETECEMIDVNIPTDSLAVKNEKINRNDGDKMDFCMVSKLNDEILEDVKHKVQNIVTVDNSRRKSRNLDYNPPDIAAFTEDIISCKECMEYPNSTCQKHSVPSINDRTVLHRPWASLPNAYLSIKTLPNSKNKLAVFSKRNLASNVFFGPLVAPLVERQPPNSPILYSVFIDDGSLRYFNTESIELCNWMSIVQPATNYLEENCLVIEKNPGQLYFLTSKPIKPNTRLTVGYSKQYASRRNLPILTPSEEEKNILEQDNQWPCYECEQAFASSTLLQKHLDSHDSFNSTNSIRKRKGSKKQMKTYAEKDVKKVDIENTKSSTFRCLVCNKHYTNKLVLLLHQIHHSNEVNSVHEEYLHSLQCPQCSSNFEDSEDFLSHIEDHSFVKEESKQTERLMNSKNLRICHDPVKVFKCPICSMNFDKIQDFRLHTNSHGSDGYYSCPKCKRRFDSYLKVRRHIKAYCEVVLKCHLCGKEVPSQVKLQRHMLVHTKQKDFKCSICNRMFNRKDKLKDHNKRLHGPNAKTRKIKEEPNQKPIKNYKCSLCHLSFKRRGMLVNHVLKCHPSIQVTDIPDLQKPLPIKDLEYPCPYCSSIYATNISRNNHIRIVHPGKERAKSTLVSQKRPKERNDQSTIKKLTNDQRFARKCLCCHKEYQTQAKLNQHYRRCHPHFSSSSSDEFHSVERNNLRTNESSYTRTNLLENPSGDHPIYLPMHDSKLLSEKMVSVDGSSNIPLEYVCLPSVDEVAVEQSNTSLQIMKQQITQEYSIDGQKLEIPNENYSQRPADALKDGSTRIQILPRNDFEGKDLTVDSYQVIESGKSQQTTNTILLAGDESTVDADNCDVTLALLATDSGQTFMVTVKKGEMFHLAPTLVPISATYVKNK